MGGGEGGESRSRSRGRAPLQAFPEQKDLYSHMRAGDAESHARDLEAGRRARRRSRARRRKSTRATTSPFQSHATMGPGCAVADVQTDGITTVWSGGQKPHALQKGFARAARRPRSTRCAWSGCRTPDRTAVPGSRTPRADAVLLSKAVGKPVRVQWMRADMTAWGAEGPGVRVRSRRRRSTAQGNVSGVEFTSRAFSGGEIIYLPDAAGNYLGAQLTGIKNTSASTNSPTGAARRRRIASRISRAVVARRSPASTTSRRRCGRRTCAIPRVRRRRLPWSRSSTNWPRRAGVDPLELRLKHIDEPRAKNALTVGRREIRLGHGACRRRPNIDRRRRDRTRHRARHAQRHLRRHDRGSAK